MPDQNKNSENSLEVVVKAIDGEALVLQTPNGDLIHWPLNQLTTTLPLGQTLKLKLEPTEPLYDLEPKPTRIKGYVTSAKDINSSKSQPSPDTKNPTAQENSATNKKDSSSNSKTSQTETTLSVTPPQGAVNTPEDPKQTRMRKLLESLLNG